MPTDENKLGKMPKEFFDSVKLTLQNNYISLIVLMLTPFVVTNAVWYALAFAENLFAAYLSEDAALYFSTFRLVATVFLTIPLFYGLAYAYHRCITTGDTDIKNLFVCFGDATLDARWSILALSLLWRLFIIFLPSLVVSGIINGYYDGVFDFSLVVGNVRYSLITPEDFPLIVPILTAIETLFYTVSVLISLRYVPVVFFAVAHEAIPVSACFRYKAYITNRRLSMWHFTFYLLLTAVSFGLFGLLYAFPYILSCYASYVNHPKEACMNITKEDIYHETNER